MNPEVEKISISEYSKKVMWNIKIYFKEYFMAKHSRVPGYFLPYLHQMCGVWISDFHIENHHREVPEQTHYHRHGSHERRGAAGYNGPVTAAPYASLICAKPRKNI